MKISRRGFVGSAVATAAALVVPRRARADLASALESSSVFYLTPLKSNGDESTCKAEIWFVADGGACYVVTSSTAWRARSIERGLNRARIWVGEYGSWQSANDAFRAAPSFEATGSVVTDPDRQRRVLEKMGDKFRSEWVVWGPRFRNGIADGSRVMLEYIPN